MSRIEINAGGRHIIVDHDGELEPLRRTALELWEATATPERSPGPATGFQLVTCDVCSLPDPYRGQGDGIGSCDCPRCDCGSAHWSVFCTCDPDDDYPWPDDDGYPWPDDVVRPIETVEIPGVSR